VNLFVLIGQFLDVTQDLFYFCKWCCGGDKLLILLRRLTTYKILVY
jgi:hypothetical protein